MSLTIVNEDFQMYVHFKTSSLKHISENIEKKV